MKVILLYVYVCVYAFGVFFGGHEFSNLAYVDHRPRPS